MIQINTKIANKERDGMGSKTVIYQFKVTLSRVCPAVWRRIEVPADATLHRLAAALITVMGWLLSRSGTRVLSIKGEQIFDEISQSEMIDEVNVRRVADAWNRMRKNLYGKKIK